MEKKKSFVKKKLRKKGKKRSPSKRGIQYEKTQSKKHKAKHLGGPGKPDYKRGKIKGEVKNWNTPVHSGIVKKLKKKGIKEIISKSGFTKPAEELAKRYKIKLITKKNN
jgi:hypothetical protein